MAEINVPGGVAGGPANIAGFSSASSFFQQLIAVSPHGTDADPFVGSPTIAGGLRVGYSRVIATSTLTRPSNTTTYAPNTLIATSTVSGSVVVPSFAAVAANAGTGVVRRIRLTTNATSGMDGTNFRVDLWTAAPTFNVGDGGIYGSDPSTGTPGIATGTAAWVGSFTCQNMRQFGDGSVSHGVSDIDTDLSYKCGASSTLLYWSLMALSGFTPISGQVFTLAPDLVED